MSLTFTDIFCGAGGSSIGLCEAGFELKLAANHWERAIETHSTNFRDAEHLIADISNYDMRRLPHTDVLWASPECTWHSPAGGRRRLRAQLDLLEDYVPTDGGIRSRATAFDVIRAAEVHAYKAVIVENVVEFADWPMFDWWLDGMRQLDYERQIVCVSSAHVGGEDNPHAPQWRDRLYVVFTRRGIPLPDVRPRPAAWCPPCQEIVAAVQSWKRPDRRGIGKYGAQYVYRCPNVACRNAIVEPFVLPAAAAIDWSDLGTRIGDRARPLAAATIRRIEAGLRLFAAPIDVAVGGNTWERPASGYVRARPVDACPPLGINVNHGGDDGRPYPVDAGPLPPRTTKIGDGVVSPPMLVPAGGTWNDTATSADDPMRTRTTRDTDAVCIPEPFVTLLRNNQTVASVDEPLTAITSGGRHHGLTVPPGAFYMKNYTPRGNPAQMSKDVRTTPLGAVTAVDHHSLVIPYRRTRDAARPKTTAEPLLTLGTRDSAALVAPAIAVEDCWFRMLRPREHLRAQRFPDSYDVKGNLGEQTMQAGNAVSANVPAWLGRALAAVMA